MMLKKFFKKLLYKKNIYTNCIYVIGNSHTRAFSFNRNFFPLFIGAGKSHCLINEESYDLLKSAFIKALENLSNQKVLLVLGEPDARYCLGKGWYPWEGNIEFDISDFRPLIQASFKRYTALLEFIKANYPNQYMVLNVMPVADDEENEIIEYFNFLLKDYCEQKGIVFVDINKNLYSPASSFQINSKFLGDQIHLNNKIQPFVEDFLVSRKLISEHGFMEIRWDHNNVKNEYKYSKQFGCYVLK